METGNNKWRRLHENIKTFLELYNTPQRASFLARNRTDVILWTLITERNFVLIHVTPMKEVRQVPGSGRLYVRLPEYLHTLLDNCPTYVTKFATYPLTDASTGRTMTWEETVAKINESYGNNGRW